ncbi:3-phenylpropionate/cinnamic acid dioxygenase ferredoxin--NAD(+) reductase component [subsurface metagenome]
MAHLFRAAFAHSRSIYLRATYPQSIAPITSKANFQNLSNSVIISASPLRMSYRTTLPSTKPKQILIVGASYAGLAAATNLLDLSEGRPQRFYPSDPAPTSTFPIEITIVDERDGYYHVIGSPLALASESFAERSWTRFEDVPGLQHPSIKVVHGSVVKVDVERKRARILPHGSQWDEAVLEQQYDYLLAASGLRRVAPVVPASLTKDHYLLETVKHIKRVRDAATKHGVVVIGGGAVGIEMAAELKLVHPELRVRLVHSRDRLMSSEPLPDDFKDEALRLLKGVGVEVLTGKRVNHTSQPDATDGTIQLTLSDGDTISTSFVINAISRAISTSEYLPSTVLDEEGYVKIKPTLHFLPSNTANNGCVSSVEPDSVAEPPYDPYHFAAGDITLWTGIRRCGAAMHMGSFAAHNIHAHILSTLDTPTATTQSPPMYKSLSSHPPMIGLALGNTGIAYSPTEGIKSGVDILKSMFQDDIGFSICWNYMKLGEAPPVVDVVQAGDVDHAEITTDTELDGIEAATGELSLDESTSKAASGMAITADNNPSSSPSLSASSSTSPSMDSPSEPQTPFDTVDSTKPIDFEALNSSEMSPQKQADIEVEAVRYDVEVPTTKVSPIRVVEAEK